jgi:peptidoglycan/LPS O-acetylase OafA/YrhL
LRAKRADIQGLRAVAVGLVLLFHAGIPGIGGGYIGVDVFFVISGFLISTHLLEGLRDRGRIGFGAFYARRARRLLPAAFTVIVAIVVAARIWVSPVQFSYVVRDAIMSALYVPNLWFVQTATDYLADKTPSLFLHYWSLGVEEQFYLVWPLLLTILFRLFGLRWRTVAALAVVVAASFSACVWLTEYSQPYAFFMLPTRVWEFGIGALVALATLNGRGVFAPKVAAVAGWIGLAAIIGSGVVFAADTNYPGFAVAVPVLGTALLIAAGPTGAGPVVLLGMAPVVWIGDISYSLYLVHWPALVIPAAATGYMEPLPLWLRALIAAACVPLAWLLYTYVELPGQRIAWLTNSRPRRTLGVTAAAMAVVSAIALVAGAAVTPVLDSGKPAARSPLVAYPTGTPYVPSNLSPSLRGAVDDKPVVYDDGCHRENRSTDPAGCRFGANRAAPLVLLLGDSHAAQWFPALKRLADRGLIRLENHTKSACPPAVPPSLIYPECEIWTRGVIANMAADPPALVLVSYFGRRYFAGDEHAAEHWHDALETAISRFPPRSRVAIIADTPSTGVTPSICLGRYLSDANRCALPRSKALDAATRSAEADIVTNGPVKYFDFTDLLCNQLTCPAIIGDTLVYRDGGHITTTVSGQLADAMMADINRVLGNPVGVAPAR